MGKKTIKNGKTLYSWRNNDFYQAKKRGENVAHGFEHQNPIPYIVEFESGYSAETMAVNGRYARINLHHLQSEHGLIKSANKKLI